MIKKLYCISTSVLHEDTFVIDVGCLSRFPRVMHQMRYREYGAVSQSGAFYIAITAGTNALRIVDVAQLTPHPPLA